MWQGRHSASIVSPPPTGHRPRPVETDTSPRRDAGQEGRGKRGRAEPHHSQPAPPPGPPGRRPSTYPVRLLAGLSGCAVGGHGWGRVVLHGGGELHGPRPGQGELQQGVAGASKGEES